MLEPKVALHTAARRYLEETISGLTQYNGGLHALLLEVLEIRPGRCASLQETRETLELAARVSYEESDLANPHITFFRSLVSSLDEAALKRVTPLPFRRVLGKDVSRDTLARLYKRWGNGGPYFYPLEEIRPPFTEDFDAEAFELNLPNYRLETIFRRNGIEWLLELHVDYGPSYEQEVSQRMPQNYAEVCWTAEPLHWLIYYSHERSVTVCGEWLLNEIKAAWPEWASHPWA